MMQELQELLDGLQDELFFFLEDGPLKNRLIEKYLEEEADADILDFELEASVRIKGSGGFDVPVIECRLEADGFQYQMRFLAADFDAAESAELMERLRAHKPAAGEKKSRTGKNILRKRPGNGLLNIAEAATALGLSQRSLKTLIPCSEIRIAEEDGNKTIEEYYWDKELIDSLETICLAKEAGGGVQIEDVTYIAEACCDGDLQWASEVIAGFLQQCRFNGN
jgi:hypothetical protein